MYLDRIIEDARIDAARFPSIVITCIINEMRAHFAPVEDLATRISRVPYGIHIRVSVPE